MATYDYETSVNLNGNYKEKPPRKEGYTTYVNGSVDVTTAGEYLVTYTFIKEDPFDSITETRLVTVVDTYDVDDSPAPEVYLYGDTVVTIGEGSSWTDPGAYAIDSDTGTSSSSSFIDVNTVLPIDGDTWASQPVGNYSILYYAVSGSNRIGFAKRTVVIERTSATIALNGCSEKYIEFPAGEDTLIYGGPDYSAVGSNIVLDAGYTISGNNYTLEIGINNGIDDMYTANPNGIFFIAEATDDTRSYEILYKLTNNDGVERNLFRKITVVKPGDESDQTLSALAMQQLDPSGCLNLDNLEDSDDIFKDTLDNVGDDINNDPDLTTNPLNPTTGLASDALYFLCAGKTAYSGGLFPSSWSSNPGKIPETIVENAWLPSSAQGTVYSALVAKNGIFLPGESEISYWHAYKGSIVWRLHTIHNEQKVTYSWGYSAGFQAGRNPSNDFIFSTWEPYYEGGVRVGDIFYGLWGAHVFTYEEGWGTAITKESITFSEMLTERKYRPLQASSVTLVTDELKQKHVAALQRPNTPGEHVFQDEQSYEIDAHNIGIMTKINSLPIYYNIDQTIRSGGSLVSNRDLISLTWFQYSGARDVSDYCDYSAPVQNKLPLYCSTTRDEYSRFDPNNYYVDTYGGPVPASLIELTWCENPYFLSHSLTSFRHSLISIVANQYRFNRRWYLEDIYPDRVVYLSPDTPGQTAEIIFDPSDPNKNYFVGHYGTYSWNHWTGPAMYGDSSYRYKYMTNYDSSERIAETNTTGLDTSVGPYYRSLVVGASSLNGSNWADPQVNESKAIYDYANQQVFYSVQESVDPC